jgi:hypothetical protein
MDDPQVNYLNMSLVTMIVMENNKNIWDTNTKVAARVAKINGLNNDIKVLAGVQSDSGKGATISEHDAWDIAASDAEHVGYGLKAYYNDIDDQTNFEQVNFTYSDYRYVKRNDALDKMKKVYQRTAAIDPDVMLDFNVTAAELVSFSDAITAFENSIPVNRTIIAGTSAATKELPDVYTELRKQYKSLDLLVGTYKSTQIAFFDAYKSARGIVDLGKGKTTVELELLPKEFKAVLGDKFKPGYWFTVRNHLDFPVTVYLTDKENELDVKNELVIEGKNEMKLEVPKDFKDVFGHYLMVYNSNTLDNVHVTIIMSKTKSQSGADDLPNIAPTT